LQLHHYKNFEYCNETAKFCEIFNNITDVLNCRNVFSKFKYDIAVNSINLIFLKECCDKAVEYISNLKDNNNQPILKSNRKTGFLGFIIAMRNIFCLYEEYNCQGLDYLLTFKLSQDFLETFFFVQLGLEEVLIIIQMLGSFSLPTRGY
jgi:hypothetical protein